MAKENGSKPKLPEDKDYVVLTSLLIEGLQKTLDLYDQKNRILFVIDLHPLEFGLTQFQTVGLFVWFAQLNNCML